MSEINLVTKVTPRNIPRSRFKSNYYTIWAVLKKWWIINLRYPVSFVFWLVAPILILLPTVIFGTILAGSRYSERLYQLTGTNDIWLFAGLGLAYIRFLYATMWTTAYAIREEEFHGTLESIYVSPPSRVALIIGSSIYALTNNGMTLIVQVIFLMILLGKVTILQIIVASGYVIASIFMIQGLSVMLSALVLRFKQGWRIVFTFEVLLDAITPTSFPLIILPLFLKSISMYAPFTIGVIGFRNALLFGLNNTSWYGIVYLFLYSILLGVIGLFIYHTQDRYLRFKGSLGKY